MALDRILTNQGSINGEYNGVPFQETDSTIVTVTIPGLTFTKHADQSIWVNDQLNMWFILDNTEGDSPVTNLVLTDVFDSTIFKYIAASLVIELTRGGTTTILDLTDDYTVNFVENTPDTSHDTLTITFTTTGEVASLLTGDVLRVSFRGNKVAP